MTDPVDQLTTDMARARLASAAAAFVFAAPDAFTPDMKGGKRSVTFVRQVAMYLTHVSFGMNLNRVAMAFGRDRSTAAHACHKIEDCRDDPSLDEILDQLEDGLRALPEPVGGAALARCA